MESTKECPVCQTFVSQVCHSVRGHTDSLSHHHMNTHTHILPIQLDEWMNVFFWHIETWSHRFSRCIYEDPQWVLSVLRGFACCRYRWCSACGSVQRLLLYCFYVCFLFFLGAHRICFVCVLWYSPTSLPVFVFHLFWCYILFRNRHYKQAGFTTVSIPKIQTISKLSDKIQTISQDLNDRCSKMSCILVWKVVHRLSLALSSFGLRCLSLGI